MAPRYECLRLEKFGHAGGSIAADSRYGYLLQYTLTGVPAPGRHDVVVRTPRFPNYTVRARRGDQGPDRLLAAVDRRARALRISPNG